MKKNFIYNFLLTGSHFLFPLLTFPYLSRVLGADGLGVCNFITSYAQNYIIIAALGIPVYAIREIAKVGDDKEKRSKLFFEILSIHLSFTFLLLIIYVISIYSYADLRQYKELALLGGSLILFSVFSIEWLFSGVNDFRYITIRSLIIRTVSIIAIFLLVKKREDFSIYFIITVLTVCSTSLVDIYSSKKFITRKVILSLKGVFTHVRAIAILAVYMVLTSIYSVLPATLLGFMSTKSSVGYYYGANKIILMIISVFSSLVTVMIPTLNLAVEKKQNEEYLSLINKSLSIVITFGIPITLCVFLLADPIVMLLAGKSFTNSILVIKIMAPIILMIALAQIFVILILSAHRKDKAMVFLSVIGMIISLAINLIFIPDFAEKATAVSLLISETAVTILAFFLARKAFNFPFPFKKSLLNLLCSIPFILFISVIMKLIQNNFLIILFSGICCTIYFLVYQLFILKDKLLIETTNFVFHKIKIGTNLTR